MARRFSAPYQSEPFSGLATWARNLAVFSVVAVLVSILIVRFGFLEMKPALATFFGALGLAGLSILIGLAGFAAIWQNGTRGMSRILLAFLINGIILAYPAYLAWQYRKLPPIHDITTDTDNPPTFNAILAARAAERANSVDYRDSQLAQMQKAAYPDLASVMTALPVTRTFNEALNVAKSMPGWIVVAFDVDAGLIEASQQSRWFRFTDDIVIRVVGDDVGSRVDMRSTSRQGQSDYGVNAARIRAYVAALRKRI